MNIFSISSITDTELRELSNRFDFADRFHWAQYHIILEKTDEMFEAYAAHLQDGQVPTTR